MGGDTAFGADISSVRDQLETDGISQIWSTNGAFFALLENKKVVAWGNPGCGADISSVKKPAGDRRHLTDLVHYRCLFCFAGEQESRRVGRHNFRCRYFIGVVFVVERPA